MNRIELGDVSKRLNNKSAAALAEVSRGARDSTKSNMDRRKSEMKELAAAIDELRARVKDYILNSRMRMNKNKRVKTMLNDIDDTSNGAGLTERQRAILKLAIMDYGIALVSEALMFQLDDSPGTIATLVDEYGMTENSARRLVKDLRMPGDELAAKIRRNSNSVEQLKERIETRRDTIHNYMRHLHG